MKRLNLSRPCGVTLAALTLSALSATATQAQTNVLTAQGRIVPPGAVVGKAALLEVKLTIQPGYHVNANPASDPYLIPTKVTLTPVAGVTAGQPVYPKGQMKKFRFSDKPLAVYETTATVRVPLSIAASAKPGPVKVAGVVKYQACNDRQCFQPSKANFTASFTVSAKRAAAVIGSNVPTVQLTGADATPNGAPNPAQLDAQAAALRQQFGVQGLPAIVFVDASGAERADLRAGEELTRAEMVRKLGVLKAGAPREANASGAQGWLARLQNAPLGVQLALVFVGGLLLNLTPCVYPIIPITVGYFGAQSEGRIGKTFGLACFYVLGLATVYSILGVSAAMTGELFGKTLQSPIAVGLVAAVLFVLALSMLGLFTIQPPQFFLSRSGAKKGALGALAMGALLGIVAAPCVGPAVGALLTYVGVKGDKMLGFLLFFSLSLGLGLPYLLLGAFAGALKSLPRSGVWLERSKKIFAVPLLLAALFYAYTAFNAAAKPSAAATTPVAQAAHWQPATQAALAAARTAKQPVVIDFRADWCLPCRHLEAEVFSKPEVHQAATGVTLLRADLTRVEA